MFESFENIKFKLSKNAELALTSPWEYFQAHLHDFDFSPKVKNKIKNLKLENNTETTILIPPDFEQECKKIIKKITTSMLNDTKFPELTVKERRYLINFYDLYINKDYQVIKSAFFDYLKSKRASGLLFRRITYMYFKHYNTLVHDTTFTEFYEYLYCQLIEQSSNKLSPGITNVYKNCDSTKFKLLHTNLPKEISTYCIEQKIRKGTLINEIFKEDLYIIGGDTELFSEVIKKIGEECIDNINKEFYLNTLINDILQIPISKTQMDELVSKIIKIYSYDDKVSSTTKDKIKKAILKNDNYKDPRIYHENWTGVDKEAKAIFIKWLAKDDLEFFFSLMFKNKQDQHGRKEFWERYINHEDLLYSKVILCRDTANTQIVKDAKRDGHEYAQFTSIFEDTDCFILAFKNIYIVEFSKKNNALYLYSKNFESSFSEQINEKTILDCIMYFDKYFSIQGIVGVLTGYTGFAHIPKVKNSKFYGLYKNQPSKNLYKILNKLHEKKLIKTMIIKNKEKVTINNYYKQINLVPFKNLNIEEIINKPIFQSANDLKNVKQIINRNNQNSFFKHNFAGKIHHGKGWKDVAENVLNSLAIYPGD